ncbi:MAG: response regulator [Desulfobacteraceae bacterium]|nr:response regulator [Desulfobacteraceae bacterium]
MSNRKQVRVMVADDEMHIRMLIKQVLKSMNADIVAEAKDGGQAVEMYKEKCPNMIFLDINMPVKTGVEALKEIIKINQEAVVIMLTSVSDMETVSECIDAGAANYIRKDTPLEELKRLIKETWAENKPS